MARRRLLPTAALVAIGLLAAAPAAQAQAPGNGNGGIKKKRVGKFNKPVHVAAAPGTPGLFVVEKDGRIRVIRKGRKRKRPFLKIRKLVRSGGEQGLLSVAFAPDYRRSRLFYVYYTNNAGDNVIAEFRRKPRRRYRAAKGSRRTVLVINHPGASNHNGGQIAFGPDGFLYAAPGDGGGSGDPGNDAQETGNLLGKVVRINPRSGGGAPYSSPAGNPFVGAPGRDEIYSLGLRNPFRFSFDRVTAPGQPRIVIGDVGQNRFEEVDYETVANARAANFGWNDFEGFSSFSGANPPPPSRHDKPIHVYATGPACAIIGGFVVRNRGLRRIYKRYVYGDACTGRIRSLVPRLEGAAGDRPLGIRVPALSSFGEGKGGKLYATSLDGPVYRLRAKRGRRR